MMTTNVLFNAVNDMFMTIIGLLDKDARQIERRGRYVKSEIFIEVGWGDQWC